MFSKGWTLAVAVSLTFLGTIAVASAACTNIQCKCAVANGGTYDPATNRWSMHGCSQAQVMAFSNCVAGKSSENNQASVEKPQAPAQKKKLRLVDPDNRFGNAPIDRQLQPVTHGTPHFNPGAISVDKNDKNKTEKRGLQPVDINTQVPGTAVRQ